MSRLSSKIRKYLRDKGVYEAVDDMLIEELCFNVEVADMAKEDIRARGIMVNVRSGNVDKETGEEIEPYMQVNQAVSVYNSAVKQITAIGTKLGMNVQERTKLGLQSKDEEDDLDVLLKVG